MPHKILLIDDSTTQLQMLKMQLETAGYQVETATDGAEGYQKVFETAPDLILSDIIMPNLNGYQFCRLVKNDFDACDIPIVLLTVLDKKIDKFWANKSGANKFISKTASFEQIKEAAEVMINENPLNQEVKDRILSHKINEETVQNRINNILDDLLLNSTFLNEFRDLGEHVAHEKVLIEKTFKLLGSFVEYNIAGLFFNNLDKNEKNILYLDTSKTFVSGFVIEKIKRDFFAAMPGMKEFSIRDFGHEVVLEKPDKEEKILSPDDLKTAHIVPIFFENKLLGGVCFFSNQGVNYPEFKFYKTMISELLLLFKMRYFYSETEYLSVTDGLTGLYNRRHFELNLEREFLRARRYKIDLSLALIDIDFFKKINDTFGHQFGDHVLREVSDIICGSFRKTDMIYRYGGEEIAVILTETPLENASIPLERLREKVSQHIFSYGGLETHATISIGASGACEHTSTQAELVERADKSLYKAKQNGRNKVVMYLNDECNQV